MGGGCADVTDAREWITRTAILANAPINADSTRANLRLVRDDAVCRGVGLSAYDWRSGDRYVVLQLGHVYWVRGTSWHYVNVVDSRFHRIKTYVDMD